MNLPNLLTIGRVFAVPLVVWLIVSGEFFWAFWLFCAAAVTDGIDGAIARAWNQRTELGAYLDPIADKTLLASIYVTLAVMGEMPRLVAILVVFRDLVIVGAVILSGLIDKPLPIEPLRISKLNTFAQILFAGVVLAASGFVLDLSKAELIGAWLVGGLTLASAGAYLAAFIRHMATD